MKEAPITCKSCGQEFTGVYCPACGEKVLTPADKSFKSILNGILLAVTFADSKFIKTLWLILRRPGALASDFAQGKRVNHLRPSSVFFILNLVYFFFPVIQLFNASLNTQFLSPLSGFYRTAIAHKLVNMHLDLSAFTMIYNLKTAGLAKLMVMIFVIISSLPLNLLYRKRNRYFTDHIGYAIELACFNLFNAIVLTVLIRLFGLGHYLDEYTLTAFFIIINTYFIVRASAVFYREKGWRLVVKSVVMVLFLKVALELYRSILFFVTLWTI